MSAENIADDSNDLKLADILDVLLQYIWTIVAVFTFVLVLGGAYVVLAPPVYRADALIQVEDNKPATLTGVQAIADALGTSSSPVSGEVEILKSREVVLKAITETGSDINIAPKRFPVLGAWYARRNDNIDKVPLGMNSYAWGGESLALSFLEIGDALLGHSFDFVTAEDGVEIRGEDGSPLAKARVGQVFEFGSGAKKVRGAISALKARSGVTFEVRKIPLTRAYKSIVADLKAEEATRQSGIIRLSYESNDVDFGRNLVNAIAKAYLTQNVERRSAEADQSLKFLNGQLPEVKRNVERAENALTDFRTKTNTVSVEREADGLLKQSVDVERNRLELQLKRDEFKQRFKSDHPQLKAIEAQLGEMEREAARVNEQVNKLPASQRDMLRLQRDAEVGNQLYIALLNNVQQLSVAKAGTVGNVRVVDYAVRDETPVAPNKPVAIAITIFAGLVLGIGAAAIARVLRPTVREAVEIERATGLVSYASIPESQSQEKLDSHHRDRKGRKAVVEGRSQLLAVLAPEDPAIESLRSLRTGLAFALMGVENKNIVITGATAGIGKSFVSANLSALLAASGKRVLLIDSDMRRPQLGTYFGYKEKKGLAEVLAKAATFSEVIYHEKLLGGELDVLPSGSIPPNPGELLLTEGFSELIESVQSKYDYIIFDSAPILPVGDTLAVARVAHAVFMVVRSEYSTVGEVQDAVKKLSSAGGVVKGFIFNGIKRKRIAYGYNYRYYYSYGSK
ncbi:polysaccharide biosynthesis tyrosine autokinase [Pigmentiphaga kullae]|uniref:Putative tyrosine-protein kinase EpsB n=1 Tax=Pigmentiphaga kullae TaxID=151784 RepID=A0A4Q7NM64_9BURK|nr:polysaccharide biosynthesis tyrosine autokinase [Pigmentiphaga kullae]RZS85966.1 tyrosine-protein kinase Etk/Wzc [Pigmentiphaga kullae]